MHHAHGKMSSNEIYIPVCEPLECLYMYTCTIVTSMYINICTFGMFIDVYYDYCS
jgi:hypothetical protein